MTDPINTDLKTALRLLYEVYSEFVDHQYIPVEPLPTDGSKDTRWMKETAELLKRARAVAVPEPAAIPPRPVCATCKHPKCWHTDKKKACDCFGCKCAKYEETK